jgi:hypothetical protein
MKHYISIFILALLAASCEKPIFDEERAASGSVADTHPNVTLHFSPYEQQAFTRAATPLTDQCTRLSVAIFTADGTKAKAITQKQTDAGFGTAALTLQAGTYKIVAIAHSSTEGNATITSPEKVTFANNKLTDTFYYYGTLTVLDGSPIEETLEMTRCVAMLRLTLTEPLSDGITRLKFYYTGGSSTFNPATGYGCVNSKQTEYRYTTNDQDMPVTVYELYTMPHEQQDVLKLTVTALDASGSEVGEVTMDNIPVTRNKTTTWQGALFGSGTGTDGGTSSSGGITITLDTEWDGTITYTF